MGTLNTTMWVCMILHLIFCSFTTGENRQDQEVITPNNHTEYVKTDTMKCYECDSKAGPCTDDSYGTETDCDTSQGCSISLGEGVLLRGCGDGTDFKCGTNMGLKFCNCKTNLCNKNWETAGMSNGAG